MEDISEKHMYLCFLNQIVWFPFVSSVKYHHLHIYIHLQFAMTCYKWYYTFHYSGGLSVLTTGIWGHNSSWGIATNKSTLWTTRCKCAAAMTAMNMVLGTFFCNAWIARDMCMTYSATDYIYILGCSVMCMMAVYYLWNTSQSMCTVHTL